MNISIWAQIIALTISLVKVTCKDYYEILGVKRDATDREIKRRFRQLGTNTNITNNIKIVLVMFL